MNFYKNIIAIVFFNLFLLVFDSHLVFAEPRFIDINQEIKLADVVALGKIISYDKETFKFEPKKGPKRIFNIRYRGDHPNLNPKKFIRSDLLTIKEDEQLTAQWPPVGMEVLVVVDQKNVISLFAYKQDKEYYRFWTPYYFMTHGLALFKCDKPAEVLKGKWMENNMCWGGCLVIESVVEKIYIKEGTGNINYEAK